MADMTAKAVRAKNTGQRKAIISVRTYADEPFDGDDSWKKDQLKRMQSTLTALEKKKKDLTPDAAFKEVSDALDLEIKKKKLDIEQHKLGG